MRGGELEASVVLGEVRWLNPHFSPSHQRRSHFVPPLSELDATEGREAEVFVEHLDLTEADLPQQVQLKQ